MLGIDGRFTPKSGRLEPASLVVNRPRGIARDVIDGVASEHRSVRQDLLGQDFDRAGERRARHWRYENTGDVSLYTAIIGGASEILLSLKHCAGNDS